jgi:hypothetical protein
LPRQADLAGQVVDPTERIELLELPKGTFNWRTDSMKAIVSTLSALILRSKPSPLGRRLASRRMAACTAVARGHPSRRIAHAMLLRMRFAEEPI